MHIRLRWGKVESSPTVYIWSPTRLRERQLDSKDNAISNNQLFCFDCERSNHVFRSSSNAFSRVPHFFNTRQYLSSFMFLGRLSLAPFLLFPWWRYCRRGFPSTFTFLSRRRRLFQSSPFEMWSQKVFSLFGCVRLFA